MKKTMLVSVIITCYNYGKYIEQSIDSVINQSYENIEIIIINDGSTDDTHTICTNIASNNNSITYIQRKNRGVIASRNEGLNLAQGDYVLFLDADDYLEKNYISDTIKVSQNERVDIVYTDYQMFGKKDEKSDFPDYSLEELKNHNFIHISSLIRRSAIKNKTFDVDMGRLSHEDWDFFLSLCMAGATAKKCKTTVLMYRIHDISRNNILLDDVGRLNFAKVYMFVTDKYPEGYPTGMNYLSGRVFADWYINMTHLANGLLNANSSLREQVDQLTSQNIVIENELMIIKKSKYYKLYKRLQKAKSRIMRK